MLQLIVPTHGTETRKIDLNKPATTLGRRSDNDIVLADRAVSGRHCVFERLGADSVVLVDLGSTNGTMVNGERTTRRQLHHGDVVTVAGFVLTFVGTVRAPSSGAAELQSSAASLAGQPVACVLLLNGTAAGTAVPLDRPVTTFGEPGLSVVALSNRRTGYFVASMESTVRPLLNASPLGFGAVALQDADVIELAGTVLRFQKRA
jgi:hypothetical protein